MRLSGVYAIVHRPSGRAYVGSSCDVFRRWRGHAGSLNDGRHHADALLDLWLIDGAAAFSFVVLEQCPKDMLQAREQEWLDSFAEPLNTSRDTRCPMFDPEVAARQGAKMKGRVFTPEHRARLSESHKGIPSATKGRKRTRPQRAWTEEERRQISARLMGHPVSDATRAKQRIAKLGKPLTKEHRASLSAAFAGRIFSREHRANLTARHWARSPNAAAVGRRISATKLAQRARKDSSL